MKRAAIVLLALSACAGPLERDQSSGVERCLQNHARLVAALRGAGMMLDLAQSVGAFNSPAWLRSIAPQIAIAPPCPVSGGALPLSALPD